jgi:ligand-binding SRPBCC domain-containing protein
MFYQFKREQFVHTDIKTLWDFASSPSNLKEITPNHMGFQITTPNITEKMYPGMIITYKVSPLLNISMNWMTEITHVKPMSFFIDEQRMGPYKLWHHQHLFEEKEGGVLMTDIVTYIPPFGILGDIANWLIIKKKLRDIFAYRFDAVDRIFPCKNDI